MSHKVLILCTCYNHEAYIGEAIQSVIDQTYRDWELLVLDDNSMDSSPAIIDSYSQSDDRITGFCYQSNLGKSKRLNLILETRDLSEIEYIAFLDSDDVWLPYKLERQVTVLKKQKKVGLVHSDGFIIDSRNNKERVRDQVWPQAVAEKRFSEIHRTDQEKSGEIFTNLLKGNFIFFSSVILRKQLAKNSRFNESIRRSMDWLYWIEIAKNTRFFYLAEPLAKYRIHGTNLQNNVHRTSEEIEARLEVMKKYTSQIDKYARAIHFRALLIYFLKTSQFEKARAWGQELIKLHLFNLKDLLRYLCTFIYYNPYVK